MVVEYLLSQTKALKNPWVAFFAGAVFASLSILISKLVFPAYTSLVMVFLTVLFVIPLTYAVAKEELAKDMKTDDPGKMIAAHKNAIAVYTFLFLGVTFGFTLWYVFLPAASVQDIFMTQSDTINRINAPPAQVTGGFTHTEQMFRIFFNNFRVMLFSILFSFIYGIGFIFIIIWNASVIATAVGNMIRSKLSAAAIHLGQIGIGQYLSIVSVGVFRYMIHGTGEIIAYIIAGFAGSMISIYIIKNGLKFESAYKIFVDVADLLLFAVLILFLSAVLEVYVTPAII